MKQRIWIVALLSSLIFALPYAKAESVPEIAMYVRNENDYDRYFFFLVSPETPINALSLEIELNAMKCDSFSVNDSFFPLVLKNETVEQQTGTRISLEIASTEKDTNNSLVGTALCAHEKEHGALLDDTSKAYMADGYGTETALQKEIGR